MTFERPLRATRHCRHYSYETGIAGRGPVCAAGFLFSSGGVRPCMPAPDVECSKREEYTLDERQAWHEWTEQRNVRLVAAIGVLPRPIPLRSGGRVKCPSCENGQIAYGRWEGGAELACTTENCCGARFNIKRGADWPSPQ